VRGIHRHISRYRSRSHSARVRTTIRYPIGPLYKNHQSLTRKQTKGNQEFVAIALSIGHFHWSIMPYSSRRRSQRHEFNGGPLAALIYSMCAACSGNLSQVFSSDAPTWSNSDDETEVERKGNKHAQSSQSYASASRRAARSRSYSAKPGHRSVTESSKARSRSFSRSHRTTSSAPLPAVKLRENIEIQVEHEDDDMSAISSGTLEQMERMQILKRANDSLQQRVSKKMETSNNTQLVPIDPFVPIASSDSLQPIFANKENIVNSSDVDSCRSGSFSIASSGTSEFESIWQHQHQRQPSISRSTNTNVDNYHLSKSTSRHSSRSHRPVFETPTTRQMRRKIQRDGIGTIQEGLFADELEI